MDNRNSDLSSLIKEASEKLNSLNKTLDKEDERHKRDNSLKKMEKRIKDLTARVEKLEERVEAQHNAIIVLSHTIQKMQNDQKLRDWVDNLPKGGKGDFYSC